MTEPAVYAQGFADATFIDEVHRSFATLWASAAHVGEEDRMLFELAVSEIASNVVMHAQGRDPIEVSLSLRVDDVALEAVFTDSADPALIDLAEVQMPGSDAESGRGLALALSVLDELVHEPGPGNVWRLRRSLHPVG
ncbi:ATP-binding protein [Microbacterium schleiferi]|uniref:ATP-binding protein n=1 Tax=Microbacterium schleiferi TaxID=69362 RepID=UPI00311F9EC3